MDWTEKSPIVRAVVAEADYIVVVVVVSVVGLVGDDVLNGHEGRILVSCCLMTRETGLDSVALRRRKRTCPYAEI